MSADLKELLSREAQRVRPAPAPIDAVLADVNGRLRHRRRRATIAAAALAVLVVVGSLAMGVIGDDSSTIDQPADTPSESWGPYRAGNTVYLDNGVQVTAKRLANRMAEVPSGVVYTTETGDVVLLTRDGERRQIGDHAGTHQGGSMDTFPEPASDPETGWVAWMEENNGRDYGQIVVYDTTMGRFGEEVDRLQIGYEGNRDCGDPRTVSYGPFAVDGGAVYYCTGQGDYVWRPTGPDGAPRRILPVAGDPTTADDYLLDVRAGRQVVIRYGGPTAITEIMPVGATRPEVVIRRDLFDGFLSHDGRYLGSLTDLSKEVYDASTGERVTPDYQAEQGERVPLAMTFTAAGDVAYAFIHPQYGDSNIVTCALPDGECETQIRDLKGGVFFANQRHQ